MKKLLYLLFVCMLAIALLSSCTSTDDAEPVVCSSYLLAVENGYTGTEEEWVSDILLEVDQLLRESGKAADAEACGKLFGELFLFVETCFDVSTDGEEKSYVLKESMTPESVLENAEKMKLNISEIFKTTDELQKGVDALRESLDSMDIEPILSAISGIKGLDTSNLNIMMSSSLSVPSLVQTVDTLTDGRTIVLEENNTIMNNKHLTFSADLSYLGSNAVIRLGHGKTSYSSTYLEITSTEMRVYTYYSELRNPVVHKHGLNISYYVNVSIDVGYGLANIKLASPTGTYEIKEVAWEGRNGEIFAEVENLTVYNANVRWFCDDYKQNIWLFGDSYFNARSTERWPSYLIKDGYTNNLMAGYPGMKSAAALAEFKSALRFGTPEYAVWCMGMNDMDGNYQNGAAQTPNGAWLAAVTEFIQICEEKGITPILSTIPSTPTRDNSQKTAWVKASGYRYIDFERAVVMRKNTGEWFPNMLNLNDNTHPLELGAKALYAQVLVDFPEIMQD